MNAVLLGALLHDLGKVGQRAGLSGNCHEIASSLLKPLLLHGMEDAIDLESVPDAGAILNSPENESARVLILADWISSGRSDDTQAFEAASPLQSLFPLVDIKKGDLPGSAFYSPKSLSISREVIFPSDEMQDIAKAYNRLWNCLIKDLALVQRIERSQALYYYSALSAKAAHLGRSLCGHQGCRIFPSMTIPELPALSPLV